MEKGMILDAVVAQSLAQGRELWSLRESISECHAKEGKTIKHDIALPISQIAEFIAVAGTAIKDRWPAIRFFTFGHLGDGNLHYNLSPPPDMAGESFDTLQRQVNLLTHNLVMTYGGSISAEHGLGVLRRDEAARYKSAVELRLMKAIKGALDPRGLMNPGKVLP
jgi:FAD/FMN-containing dehydrogenase